MKLSRPGALLALLLALVTLSSCNLPGAVVETPTPLAQPTATLPEPTSTPKPPPDTPTVPQATNTPLPPAATDTPEPPPPTDTPAPVATSTSTPQPAPHLVYLDPDGVTVKSINSDGTEAQTLTKLDKPAKGSVIYVSADPTGRYILYGTVQSPEDYQPAYSLLDLQAGGAPVKVGPVAGTPRWSPAGDSFTGQGYKADNSFGPIFIYYLAHGQRTDLSAEGTPDFLPDGKRLVYVQDNNVYLFDPSSGTSAQLTHLPNDDQNAWLVEEAHPLPGAPGIIFFGGQFRKDGEQLLGAQGNGQQWWQIPAAGGDPQPWTEPGGNYIAWYASTPAGNRLAFVDSAHSSACVSVHTLEVMSSSGGTPQIPTEPDLSEKQDGATSVEGLAWSPDGKTLAFAARPYSCADPGAGRVLGTPEIYLWDPSSGSAQPRKLAEGLYPSWVR